MDKNALIITRNFPPLTGGMEKMLLYTYRALAERYGCRVVAPKGAGRFVREPQAASEVPLRPLPLFLAAAFIKAFFSCLRQRPGVIVAGSGLVAPIAVALARIFGAKAVTIVHGLDLIVENVIYQKVFVPFIRRSDCVMANSTNTRALAVAKGVTPDRLTIIHPGVELDCGRDHGKSTGFRDRFAADKVKILLSVGRLMPRKGLAEFIEKSFVNIIRQVPEARLAIIGGEPADALNRKGAEVERIRLLIARHGLEGKVLLLGRVSDEVLLDAYRESDLFVFPVIETPGDVEGFGMVAVEAAAHGLPVVAFHAGGIGDAVQDGQSGFLVAPGNYEQLTKVIVACLQSPEKGIDRQDCLRHAEKFSWQHFGEKLRACVAGLLSEGEPCSR